MAANGFGMTTREFILQTKEEALMALKGYEFFGEHDDGEPVWALMPEDRLPEQMGIIGACIEDLGCKLMSTTCACKALEEMLRAHGIDPASNHDEFWTIYSRIKAETTARCRAAKTDPNAAAGEEAANGAD